MLRTNTKEVKKYFDNYLMKILEDNFEGNIKAMQEQFIASASDSVGRLYKGFKTYQEAFTTISENYGCIYYDDMRSVLKEALQETEEEANKYNNDKVAFTYNYLLFMAYDRAMKKEGLSFSSGFRY